MPTLPFVKVEGLSNDFVLFDLRAQPRGIRDAATPADRLVAQLSERAVEICDRRLGVGGDGILLLTDSDEADARMIVVNADGSRPEMCGNGLRCAAQALCPQGGSIVVETDAGLLRCEVTRLEAGESKRTGGPQDADTSIASTLAPRAEVLVSMGAAVDRGIATTVAAPGRPFHNVSMGNPHAIHFVDATESPEALARSLGPAIERAPEYPARTNVEFAHVEDPEHITLWVWERGCGITAACGTGACATAAAAVAQSLAAPDRPIAVRLPGGTLAITVPGIPGAPVMMRGPARQVFAGAYELPEP